MINLKVVILVDYFDSRRMGDRQRWWGTQACEGRRRAIELDPNYAAPHDNLGNAYDERGLVDQAIAEYKQALALDLNFVGAHYNLGIVYDRKGWIDQAMAQYKRAIELDPNHMKAHYCLGNAYRIKGSIDEAKTEYSRAVEIDPKFAEAHFNLAYVYYLSRRFDLAWRHLRIAEKLGMPTQNVNQLINELRKVSREPSLLSRDRWARLLRARDIEFLTQTQKT